MSIFGSIMSAIFKPSGAAATAPRSAPPAAPGRPDTGMNPASGGATATAAGTGVKTEAGTAPPAAAAAQHREAGAPASHEAGYVDVAAVLDGLASDNPEKLDWRRSIVDLMKLLSLDSSLAARKDLAHELHYPGDMSDSAAMNVWLHRQVMKKLADNGGKVPADLLQEHHALAK